MRLIRVLYMWGSVPSFLFISVFPDQAFIDTPQELNIRDQFISILIIFQFAIGELGSAFDRLKVNPAARSISCKGSPSSSRGGMRQQC